jgi:spore coat polysaccharide biosynthesis predicted glycosyltransferase SpsG
MAEADLAITAAGSTCWEFAFIGTPMVAVPLAENQHVVARGLSAAGIAHVPGGPGQRASAAEIREAVRHLRMAPDCRSMMAQRGQELVDARGAERVASVLRLTAGKG